MPVSEPEAVADAVAKGERDQAALEKGRQLHREFVGMLFALAIAEVVVQASGVVNSGVPFRTAVPTYAHLSLAAAVIVASWVGWGWSKAGLSNVRSIFTRDFVELLLDLWLVTLYFFIAKGAELPRQIDGKFVIHPSMANEVSWLLVVFVTYAVWDCWTKWGTSDLFQRGWASVSCALLLVIARVTMPLQSADAWRVVAADISLLLIVILFRVMKRANLSDLTRKHWRIVAMLLLAWVAFLIGIHPRAALLIS